MAFRVQIKDRGGATISAVEKSIQEAALVATSILDPHTRAIMMFEIGTLVVGDGKSVTINSKHVASVHVDEVSDVDQD